MTIHQILDALRTERAVRGHTVWADFVERRLAQLDRGIPLLLHSVQQAHCIAFEVWGANWTERFEREVLRAVEP